MINVILVVEETVIRHVNVLVPDGVADPERYVEVKFWKGEYDGSIDVDRRGEHIITKMRGK